MKIRNFIWAVLAVGLAVCGQDLNSGGAGLLSDGRLQWYAIPVDGAEGRWEALPDNAFRVTKSNGAGVMIFANAVAFPIVPGRTYQVEVDFHSDSDALGGHIMLAMPGGERTPFPTGSRSGEKGDNHLSMFFTAAGDETELRIHLVLTGDPGSVGVTRVRCFEVDPVVARLQSLVSRHTFTAPELARYWTSRHALRQSVTQEELTLEIYPEGGLVCRDLNWNAADIAMVEIDFQSQDEGGYLRFDFTAQDGDQTYSSYVNMSTYSDGVFRRLQFPVAGEPAWRGTIVEAGISWMSTVPGTVAFRSLEALPECNWLPGAAALRAGVRQDIPLFKPRARYHLSYSSAEHPAGRIDFFDRRDTLIASERLPADASGIEFQAPELAARAEFTADLDSTPECFPVLREIGLPPLNRPPAYWRGSWIWNQTGFGPNNTNIWFSKEFTLTAEVESAAFAGAGDDLFELLVNGKRIGDGTRWDEPERFDIASALKPGTNRITVRVYNYQAWGGFLGEVYIRTRDGRETWLATGEDWQMAVGGDAVPTQFPDRALELGAPPVAPWGTRVNYRYIGPAGKIRILEGRVGNFRAEVLRDIPVDTDQLHFRIVAADGSSQTVKGQVSPGTAAWKAGSTVTVQVDLPEAAGNADAGVYLAEDFLEVEGNTPAGMRTQAPPELPRPIGARIVGTGFRPWIQLSNGKALPPIYYDLPGTYTTDPDSRDFLLRNADRVGCGMVRFGVSLADFWPAPGEYDFSGFDRAMEVFKLNTRDMYAFLIVRTSPPEWWLERNPDDVTAYYGAAPRHPQKDKQALASQRWLRDMSEVLRAFVRHVQDGRYADAVIGFGISEGWNSEWFWSYADANDRPAMAGYSAADLETFRGMLRDKYRDDRALAAAYDRPGLTFDTVAMPAPERLNQSSIGTLLDPVRDRDIIDWFAFRNRSIGNALEHLCRVVKEESDGRLLTGAYYGYLVAFSHIFNHLQSVGHLAIRQIIDSPYVDLVWAPSFYTWRRLGMGDGVMQCADAFSLNGKLVVVEQDMRTYSQNGHYEAANGKLYTVDQSIGAMNRAFAMLSTRGLGTHYMEMMECWFVEPVLLDVIQDQLALYRELPPVTGTVPPGVCIVSDTESPLYVKHNQGDGVHQGLIAGLLRRIQESGFAWRHVLLDDLIRENSLVPAHHFYIVTNLLKLEPGEIAALRSRWEREKASVLFLYGPGFTDGQTTPSAEQVSRTLGITVTMDGEEKQLEAVFNDAFGLRKFADINRTAPHFLPQTGFAEELAADTAGKPLVVGWEAGGVRYYFSALSMLPPEILRQLAASAGVWIYGDSGDPVYAGNDLVFLYAKRGGIKRLQIPAGLRLRPIMGLEAGDVADGEFTARPGQTYGFIIEYSNQE